MTDLSILIPARREQFLNLTIQDILKNMRGDTEVIAVLDGNWPEAPIPDHPRVHLIYHAESIGQRAAVNEAARLSSARYIMKLDAHCALDEGFDVKLLETFEPEWTVIPRMYNLHVFDWLCASCGRREYQGPRPERCANCGEGEIVQDIVWQPRRNRRTDFARFDNNLHFQYWSGYEKRPEARGDIADVMCCVGACWAMTRERFWALGGLDEAHGSWGQMGVEIACKSWLSGGRQVVNKRTWFAHLFRTQPGFGFPYPNPGVGKARERSHHLWMGNNWPGAKRPLNWLLDKFAPIPDWTLPLKQSAGVVYYTDARISEPIASTVRRQIERGCNGHQVVSVSLAPLDFGNFSILFPGQRGPLTLFKQILAGLEQSSADIIFLCEHDVLYHPSHFRFIPPERDRVYYNQNVWQVRVSDGRAVYYEAKRLSQLCAYRDILIEHYRKRVERVERDGFSRRIGFEPGSHGRAERIDDLTSGVWLSEYPNLDLKHGANLTQARWSPSEFRDQRNCRGWREADEIPGWGKLGGRFADFLQELNNAK